MDCVIIEIIRNSYGTGYYFSIGNSRRERGYYGYSKKQALQLFRNEYGLNNKHLHIMVFSGFNKLYSGSACKW